MRGRPKVTERVIGGSILVLLGCIVFLFLITSGLFPGVVGGVPALAALKSSIGISENPLFLAAPENAARPLPSPEMRVAAALLPELPPPWLRADVTAGDPDEALAARPANPATGAAGRLQRVLHAYDAALVLRAEYRRSDIEGGRVHVAIADLGSPEAAFGAWRELQPDEAQPLAVGCAGWRTDGHSAFWAGRYFTDIVGRGGMAEELARSLASMQLIYGPPFWAETVLPQDGRVERSLRYVKKAALGIDELNDCWLAEYPGKVTLGVMRAASPAKLLQALGERLKNGSSEPAAPADAGYGDAPGGYEDAQDEAAASPPAEANLTVGLGEHAVSGRLADKAVAAFGVGPYVFVTVGSDAGAMRALAQSVHDRWASQQAIASAQAAAGPGSAGGRTQSLLPEVSGANVLAPTKIERYTDNLYEKINGREGQFRSFNFVELRFGQYVDSRSRRSFDVYVYDMAEPLNAMGIYKAEQSENPELVELGREGYASGPNVYFWKSKYYVNVLGPVEGGDAAAETARKIAGAIAENITDEAGGIWAEALLPKEDLVAGSLSYRATSGLGHEFLQELFVADYKTGGTEYQMFILRQPDAAGAGRIFSQFADATAQYDKIVSREATDGGETLVGESGGVFTVAFQRGIYFGGVTECDDKELALRQAAKMRDALPASARGAAAAGGAPSPAKPKPQPAGESEGGEHEY